MKKIFAFTLMIVLIMSIFPGNIFASDDNSSLGAWFEKLESFTNDLGSASSAKKHSGDAGFTASQLYEMTVPKVVEILTYDANGDELARGSGFFINDQGAVVTNFHVIEDSSSATVQNSADEIYDVLYVLGYDPVIDLAILATDISGNEYITISERGVETGDTIYTLGSSLGLTGTFSDGLVSTASRIIDGVDNIQITAPISQGNSGGPLINIYGEAVGVNTWGYVDGQNINFAVNINELTKLDLSAPLTLPELYDLTAGSDDNSSAYVSSDPEIQAWYEDSDRQEVESNDSLEWADVLYNNHWMAGCVDGAEDFDCFSLKVAEPATVSAIMVPFYSDDTEYILMGLADDEMNIIAVAEPSETESGTAFNYLETEVDIPGTYYIMMCIHDEYPYDSPAYYQINAEW